MSEQDYELREGKHYNQRGVIADTYSDLQALHIFKEIQSEHPLPPASRQSVLRSVLQSIEVALLNLSDLIFRASNDISNNDLDHALTKISWMRGFHYILEQLSQMPTQLGFAGELSENTVIRITDSPAMKKYFLGLRKFDISVKAYLVPIKNSLEEAISHKSLDDNLTRFIQQVRICNHATTIWEHNLALIYIPAKDTTYLDFVVPDKINEMVYDRELTGDTYFMQFRAFHQIPEILTYEINNLIEHAILRIREQDIQTAVECLTVVNTLSPGVVGSIMPIADNLTTSDYHHIRENLGITSGSHSENIHYHLFQDLYSQLGKEYEAFIERSFGDQCGSTDTTEIVRFIDANRHLNETFFMAHLLTNQLLDLHMFVFHWRDGHLHLPRNTVGGHLTKSLKGAPDAVQTVKNMRQQAFAKDELRAIVIARLGNVTDYDSPDLPLAQYFSTSDALDDIISSITGAITKIRFGHVQHRTGIFAEKGKFVPPVKRKA